MVIRRRLFVMMSVMAVSSLLMLLLFWLMLQRNISGVMTSRNTDAHSTLQRIIELEGRVMSGLAYDYTYWTEMVDFVGSADETWAEQNLDAALESFRCDNGELAKGQVASSTSPRFRQRSGIRALVSRF